MTNTNLPRILFTSQDQGSWQAILPVISRISKRREGIPIVLALPTVEPLLDKWEIAYEHLDLYQYELSPANFFNQLLLMAKPHVVVSGSSPVRGEPPSTVEQHLIQAARAQGIPSVGILDVWGSYYERFAGKKGSIDPILIPDHLCVPDLLAKSDLLAIGIPETRLSITHNPWMDEVYLQSQEELPKPSLLEGADRNILFISQPLAEHQSFRNLGYTQHDLFAALIDALHQIPSDRTRIIVWVHPAEKIQNWESLLPFPGDVEVTISDHKERAVLKHADLLITSHSTLAYEAAYFDTPCVRLGLGGHETETQITDTLGLSVVLNGTAELVHFMRTTDLDLLLDKLCRQRQQLTRQGVFFSDGKATERVVRFVLGLCGVESSNQILKKLSI